MDTKYPYIEELVLGIAACNGILNRNTPKDRIIELTMQAVCADGVVTEDVVALEKWLGALSIDQRLVLEDGEQEEMATLVADSPTSMVTGMRVGQLIDDIYDQIVNGV